MFRFGEYEFENMFAENLPVEISPEIDEIIRLMHSLKQANVSVFELGFFEGKRFAEMVFILKISEPSLKIRTCRALDNLREL